MKGTEIVAHAPNLQMNITGVFPVGTSFNLIQAKGIISGTFAGIANNTPFVAPNGQAVQVNKLGAQGPGSGPAVLEVAREMDRTARQLDAATIRLEKRAETVSSSEDRTVAQRMKAHSDNMVRTVDKLISLFR